MSRFAVVVVIAGAAVVYVVLVFALGALKREDMEMIPGGKKIERLLIRLRLWK